MTTRVWDRCWNKRESLLRVWILWMCGVGLCLAGFPEIASSQVPRIQGQGAAASAMSNAFSAQADDPSALTTIQLG